MNTFKKGDVVKLGSGETVTVRYIDGPWVYHDGPGNYNSYGFCTLVPQPKFKPGDVVRNNNGTINTIRGLKTCYNPTAYEYVGGGWDREWSLTLVQSARDVLVDFLKADKFIEAIKQYRAMHGAGLLEAKNAVEALRDDLKRGDPSTTPKPATTNPSIVAIFEHGKYRPNSNPRVHDTKALAIVEAERLAVKHPGFEFGVFVLASKSRATAPVKPTITTVSV